MTAYADGASSCQGVAVHQLADFNVFAQNLGSVHCIKKYLARD